MGKLSYFAAVVGGAAFSIYCGVKYAAYSWIKAMAARAVEMSARQNLKYRFELNLKDCHFVVESLLPSLKDGLYEELNVELLTQQLKLRQVENSSILEQPQKHKREMWSNLKIISFARTICAVYFVNLVAAFTCVQLSLLGRFVYLDSCAAAGDNGDIRTISEEMERNYLTMSWYLLNVGWKKCVERVRSAVETVIGSLPLTSSISHNTILEIASAVRKHVEFQESGIPFRFDLFLLPPEGDEQIVLGHGGIPKKDIDPGLKMLLDETRDFLESDDFMVVLSSIFEESFYLLSDQFKPAFYDQIVVKPIREISFEAGDDGSPSASDQTSKSFPLAGILPLISRGAHQVINGVPNLYLDVALNNPKLLAFSAIIYSGWE